MPTVYTIQGHDSSHGERCKTVRNPKTGCSVQLCPKGKTKKGKVKMAFKKGTTRCPQRSSKGR